MKKALDGIRVLDLTESIAGNHCGKLLWRHGAEVTLVERPGGSPLRTAGPPSARFPHDASPLFRHLNAGKSSVSVDLTSTDGRSKVLEKLGECDVVLLDGETRKWIIPDSLPASVVAAQIDDFPAGTERESWQASELIHQALSGAMYVTGSPEREPLYGAGHRSEYVAGVTAYSSVLAALIERGSSGLGQFVFTSVMESAAATGQNIITLYGYNGTYQNRREYPGMLSILRCRDGWVIMFALRQWQGLCETFGVPELVEDPRFVTPIVRAANWLEADAILAEAAREMNADDLVTRAQERKVSIEKVHTMGDLVASPQMQLRRMIRETGGAVHLGPVFRSMTQEDDRSAATAAELNELWPVWGAA